jgi:hypothetical protein
MEDELVGFWVKIINVIPVDISHSKPDVKTPLSVELNLWSLIRVSIIALSGGIKWPELSVWVVWSSRNDSELLAPVAILDLITPN